jgi:hypothetical protein
VVAVAVTIVVQVALAELVALAVVARVEKAYTALTVQLIQVAARVALVITRRRLVVQMADLA